MRVLDPLNVCANLILVILLARQKFIDAIRQARLLTRELALLTAVREAQPKNLLSVNQNNLHWSWGTSG